MRHDSYPDAHLLDVLEGTRTVAHGGREPRWHRPSFFVMKYLLNRGFAVHPVNPRAEGQTILGQRVYGRLEEVPGPFEMVDIFRAGPAAAETTAEAIALAGDKGVRTIWMQLGVREEEAAARAEAAGLTVIMNRCPKIEWSRLHGELSWGGINAGVISSRRRRARRS